MIKTVDDSVAGVMAKAVSDTLGQVGPSHWSINLLTRYQR